MTELDTGKKLLLVLTGILVFFLLLPYFGVRFFRDSSAPPSDILVAPEIKTHSQEQSSKRYTIRSPKNGTGSKNSGSSTEPSKRKDSLEDIDSLLQ